MNPMRPPQKRQRNWSRPLGIGLIAISACGMCLMITLLLDALGIIPSAEESNQTKTVEQSTALVANQTAAALITPSATSPPTNTPPPTNTLPPTNTSAPSSTPEPTATLTPEVRTVLDFTSQENGLQAVIGPIDIPDGLYRAVATTTGFMIANLETLAGECTTSVMGLFNLSMGQADDGAETLFASDGCRATISISNTQSAWTLEFSQILRGDLSPLQTSYSSGQFGLYAVIGPVQFPDGRYRVTATTTGFMIADVQTAAGSCDDGILGLFNVSSGQADDGAESMFTSDGCVGIITISNVQSPWTLEFEVLQ